MLIETETVCIREFKLSPGEVEKYQALITNKALEREFGAALQDLCLSKQTVMYQIRGFEESYQTGVNAIVHVMADKSNQQIIGIIGSMDMVLGDKQKKVIFITVDPTYTDTVLKEEVVQAYIDYLFKTKDEKNYLVMLSGAECEHTVKIWKSIDISTWKKRKINGLVYDIGVITP